MVDQCDLLALELVETAFLLAQRLDQHVGRQPVGADQREVPFEDRTVLAFAAPVASRDQRNLVNRRFLRQGKGDAGRKRLEDGGAAVFALEPFVAFDAARRVVAGFAFFVDDLDAIDAAVRIDQFEVVGIAIGPGHAVGRVGPGAVGQTGEKLVLGLCMGAHCERCQRGGKCECANFHGYLLFQ